MIWGSSNSCMTQQDKFTPRAPRGVARLCPADAQAHLEGPRLLHSEAWLLGRNCWVVGSAWPPPSSNVISGPLHRDSLAGASKASPQESCVEAARIPFELALVVPELLLHCVYGEISLEDQPRLKMAAGVGRGALRFHPSVGEERKNLWSSLIYHRHSYLCGTIPPCLEKTFFKPKIREMGLEL